MTHAIMTFQTHTWLIKTYFKTGAIIEKTHSYWFYANKRIAMKKKILIKSCQIFEELGREKNINISILLMRV